MSYVITKYINVIFYNIHLEYQFPVIQNDRSRDITIEKTLKKRKTDRLLNFALTKYINVVSYDIYLEYKSLCDFMRQKQKFSPEKF